MNIFVGLNRRFIYTFEMSLIALQIKVLRKMQEEGRHGENGSFETATSQDCFGNRLFQTKIKNGNDSNNSNNNNSTANTVLKGNLVPSENPRSFISIRNDSELSFAPGTRLSPFQEP